MTGATRGSSPEARRRKSGRTTTTSASLAASRRERDALLNGTTASAAPHRAASGSAATALTASAAGGSLARPSPSPAHHPPLHTEAVGSHGEIHESPAGAHTHSGGAGQLLNLTILASGHGPDRRLETQAEPSQTIAELCVQAHPALVMAGHPVGFHVVSAGQAWSSVADGMLPLSALRVPDGGVLEVRAAPPPAPPPQPPAPPAVQYDTLQSPPPLPPSPEPLQGVRGIGGGGGVGGSSASPLLENDEASIPQPEPLVGMPLPTPQPQPQAAEVLPAPVTPAAPGVSGAPHRRHSKKDTVALKLIAKERRGSERVYDCEVSYGEKLVSLCKRCNLTEPSVSARNAHYRGFVVRHATTGELWTTKSHGRRNVREMRLQDGDCLAVEMDWQSLQGSSVPLAQEPQPPQQRSPRAGAAAAAHGSRAQQQRAVTSAAPLPLLDAGLPPAYATLPPAGLIESPEEGGVSAGLLGRAAMHGFPEDPEGLAAAAAAVSAAALPGTPERGAGGRLLTYVSPLQRPASPSPVAVGVAGLHGGEVVRQEMSPVSPRGLPDHIAWASFVDALSSVLHEQDLLLVSAETVRDLIRHYGFDRDPIVAAKVELHWKRLTGRTPSKASPRKRKTDPRHVPARGGRRDQQQQRISEEASRRIERGQLRRQQIAMENEQAASRTFAALPFGGGAGESPIESGAVGRRLEPEASTGRKRAVTPPTHLPCASERRHDPNRSQRATHSDPNTLAEGNEGHEFLMYSRELRSIEFNDNRNKQMLVAPGRKHQGNHQRNEGHLGEGMVGGDAFQRSGSRGRIHGAARDAPPSGCDPNPQGPGDAPPRRGRQHSCGPDQRAAACNPNQAGGAEPPGSQKLYGVGPERTTASCNPNELGALQQGQATSRAERRGCTLSVRGAAAVGCNPNDLHEEGEARHREAERAARVDSDAHFRQDARPHAESNPNSISARGSRGRTTRRGVGEAIRADAGAGCNPNDVRAEAWAGGAGVAGHLQGPAGVAGVFSPGLASPSPSSRRRVGAGVSNPNATHSGTALHLTAQGPITAAGLAAPSRKMANVDPNSQAPVSPKTGGRKRIANHPATSDVGVKGLMVG